MTLSLFKTTFPEFSDISVNQHFDDPDHAEALIAQVKDGLKDEAATTLARDIDAAVWQIMTDLIPAPGATTNTDIKFEDPDGRPIPFDAVLDNLRAPEQPPRCFRIANHTLEQNFQGLLEHLTARRIAEEMDAPTFVERLRGAFKRAHDGAMMQADAFTEQKASADRAAQRLAIASALLPAGTDTTDPTIEAATSLVKSCTAFVDHLQRFLTASSHSLRDVHAKFCAETNRAGVEGESILVSRETERHAVFRPLPILWALTNTVLVKIVLAHNTSETLHYQAVPILALTFLLTWTLSICFGIWGRSKRMKKLQAHTRDQLRSALGITGAQKEDIEFPSIGPDWRLTGTPPLNAFKFRGQAAAHTRRVAVSNGWALIIPALLAAVVLVTRKEVEHDFIARFPQSEACVLASGHLVFATKAAYYVQPTSEANGVGTWLLNRIVPELNANVIDRTHVISIRKFLSDDPNADRVNAPAAQDVAGESLLKSRRLSLRLRDCAATDPGRNTFTLSHEGLPDAAQAAIITPLINEIAAPAETVPSHSQTFFQTTIGIAGDTPVVETVANALILPFFSSPVQSAPETIDTPDEAFRWGADTGNLNDPEIAGPDMTYFRRIANTLGRCLVDEGAVEIDVIGLASRSWNGPTPIHSADVLNHALAEGRRLGALKVLGGYLANPEQASRLSVRIANGASAPLQQILNEATGDIAGEDFRVRFGRFADQIDFQDKRAAMVAVTALDPFNTSPLEELFGRSVVLEMISAEDGPCQF